MLRLNLFEVQGVKSIRCDPDGYQTDPYLLACSRVGRVQHPVQSQTFHRTIRRAAEHSIDAFERDLGQQIGYREPSVLQAGG